MNVNCCSLIKVLCVLCTFTFCGCYFNLDDKTDDYAPSVQDVVGCWVSTENRVASYHSVDTLPPQTCMEFCLQEDSSFTYVSRIYGLLAYPELSADLYGVVDPVWVNLIGEGGDSWKFSFSKKNSVKTSNGGSSKQGYDFQLLHFKIRLNENRLSGLDSYEFLSKGMREYYDLDGDGVRISKDLDRKYSRTNDKNFCDNLIVK